MKKDLSLNQAAKYARKYEKNWLVRLIIVDTGSTDNTIQIAKSYNAENI